MSFRRKTYPEVAESLLNRLLGGVSGETHPYPPALTPREPFSHALERAPVAQITAVWGQRNGETTRFERDADYVLAADSAKLEWKPGGARPDEGSAFEVHYLPRQREAGLNDLYPGSVVRTLMESVALETAALYAQMDAVYRAGFIDTASGGALDHVVGLLGLQRVRAGRHGTELRFSRSANARGAITLPAGTRAATADGAIEYETLADLTLADGQANAKVPARDTVAANDAVAADTLTLLTRPVVGIAAVSNPAASSRLSRDETDDELRTRARRFLVGSERGTLAAIEAAVLAEGVRAEITEPEPGRVLVLLQGAVLDEDPLARVRAAVDRVRPAGVLVQVLAGDAPVKVAVDLRLTSAAGLLEAELRAMQDQIRQRVADYLLALPLKDDGSVSKLIGLAMGVAGVEDARLTAVHAGTDDVLQLATGKLTLANRSTELGEIRISDPALATGLTLVLRYPRDATIPDQAAAQAAVEAAVGTLNDLAALADPANDAKRVLGWGRLTRLLPLPVDGFVPATLAAQWAGSSGASDADVLMYSVQWVLSRPTGVSQALDATAAPNIALGTEERLSVVRVSVDVKPKPVA